MLVVAFKIKVGLGALFMCAARVRALEHRGVRGTRVKPHFQNIAALGVLRRIGCATGCLED